MCFVLGGDNMFRIFDRKGEIGNGLEITPIAGATAASLGVWRTELELKEKLITSVMSEEITRRQAWQDLMGWDPDHKLLIPTMMLGSSGEGTGKTETGAK